MSDKTEEYLAFLQTSAVWYKQRADRAMVLFVVLRLVLTTLSAALPALASSEVMKPYLTFAAVTVSVLAALDTQFKWGDEWRQYRTTQLSLERLSRTFKSGTFAANAPEPERLQKLVNALLDFSRVEAGRATPHFRVVDLARLTSGLAEAFRPLMARGNLRFDVDCAPLSRPVAVDREQWEKIVFNLLSNAFKFTIAGGVSVRLREDGDGALLEVADTGSGIAPSELEKLFERFHRVRDAGGRSFEGTGIGLALVRELVTAHGGEIAVASELGRDADRQGQPPSGPGLRRCTAARRWTRSIAPTDLEELAARALEIERRCIGLGHDDQLQPLREAIFVQTKDLAQQALDASADHRPAHALGDCDPKAQRRCVIKEGEGDQAGRK